MGYNVFKMLLFKFIRKIFNVSVPWPRSEIKCNLNLSSLSLLPAIFSLFGRSWLLKLLISVPLQLVEAVQRVFLQGVCVLKLRNPLQLLFLQPLHLLLDLNAFFIFFVNLSY